MTQMSQSATRARNSQFSLNNYMVFETQTQSYQANKNAKEQVFPVVPQQHIPTTLKHCPLQSSTRWIATKKSDAKQFSEKEICVPSPRDVICCKGNLALHHEGNIRLQGIVRSYVDQYEAAQSKAEKSTVVSLVISTVREESGGGRFVRKDPVNGTWKVATPRFAREKVGQLFRNVLHSQYKSSTVSKRRRREVLQANYDSCLMDVVRSSDFVKEEMTALSERVSSARKEAVDSDDETAAKMFLESNIRLLEHFKEAKAVAKLSSMTSYLLDEL